MVNRMVDRKKLFTKWNDVSILKQKDGSYVCYECKLNHGNDIAISNVRNTVYHAQAHINDGHKMWGHQIKGLRLAQDIEERGKSKVTIHYAISNNGDGSASVHFFKTKEDSIKFDTYEQEHYDGFAESEYFTETLHFDKDGILINASEPDYEDEES